MSAPASPNLDPSTAPVLFSRTEWSAILMCIGFTGNEALEGHAPQEALPVAIAAKKAAIRALGDALYQELTNEDALMEAAIQVEKDGKTPPSSSP